MGNKIKKDSILIVAETLTDSGTFKVGMIIGNYKDDVNRWITTDSNGKKWQNLHMSFKERKLFQNHQSILYVRYYILSAK